MTKETKKGSMSKSKIFKAAMELIHLKGFDEIKVKDICKKSGTAVGTFYHYFHSKQDILLEFVKMEGQDVYNIYLSLEGASCFDRLVKSFEFQINYFYMKNKEFIAIILSFALKQPNPPFDIYDYSIYRIISECIAKGQASGEFSNKYSGEFLSRIISDQFLGMTYYWICLGNNDDIGELFCRIKNFLEIILLERR